MSVNDALRARSSRATSVADVETATGFPPATVDGALQEMFAAADVIFSGKVTAVERGEDVVTVRFAVEDGIRGVRAGGTYSLREWSGPWAGDAWRYVPGQHLLMLLHAPSVAGLASPVRDGAIPLSGDAVTGTADLRWVALHTAVTDAARMRPVTALRAAGGSLAGADALLQRPGDIEAVAAAAPVTGDVHARVDQAVVMDMLHAWQQQAERVP